MHHTATVWKFSRALALPCLLASMTITASGSATDEGPVGYWIAVDDDGKTPMAVVRIFDKNKHLYGNVVQLLNPKRSSTCDDCDGANKGKPILGMQIMWNLGKNGSEWSGGHILDPNNGKIYKCYIEVIDGGQRMKVRGYIGISLLGRTQYWRRTTRP